jgi:hypothetical protein
MNSYTKFIRCTLEEYTLLKTSSTEDLNAFYVVIISPEVIHLYHKGVAIHSDSASLTDLENRVGVIKINLHNTPEHVLKDFLDTLDEGVYTLHTELYGHELFFKSISNDIPEYSRINLKGYPLKYDMVKNIWVSSIGHEVYVGNTPPENTEFVKMWFQIDE